MDDPMRSCMPDATTEEERGRDRQCSGGGAAGCDARSLSLSLSLSLAASQRSRAVFKALPPSTPLNRARARSHHPRSSFLRRTHLQFVFQLQSIFTDEMNDGAKEEDPARSYFFFTNPSRLLPAGTRGVEDEPERGRRAAPLKRKSVCGEWHPS